ncbi:hypothetical protein PFAG_04092 [Plasmodium falciparum Santa Lucia]|uniref:Uncharacterized protein n=9 Tax=Plasmodium falciparum TaxID=5833 RepID=Q8I508_PLAF7|nr:conserved Plasmodium protein, unknown function [Plasmodium falciparum 3D7]ETW31965.1 hypothetical protein PFFCH_00617 [Plasmodium falciparum FCH/4]ETW47939.1 hypothetical protein PFMALIP_03974 [Plasmodium falciparum MaliPS096_E11]ETW60020.1 hypothetical protein PFMC_04009 [Plasmodium falciparum CAMP/Malaysia]EUT81911.1 hypothetical protein PFAG_04092 [Plasmodium falciparum Santa Lucia]EWC87156.1 hypothetical protein PFNF54_03932 [Plasmodium falciparum NF54]KNG76234.1 hypothetical protein P|eukprot:XP_001350809.1 conserved Plasmodium protein, unknown function [Plasmodium falciparum 3D7]
MINKNPYSEKKNDISDKLNYKNINDVSIHELNCLKNNRAVYLKRGNMFFISSKEEALEVLKNKSTQMK